MAVTTPAGINPFTGDPNWQRLATYLVGAASTGIGLNEYGNLVNLSTASGATVAGIAPVSVTNNSVSLLYVAPLINSAGSLGLAYAAPLYLNNGTLSILIPAATASALKVSGGSLWLSTAAPLGQLGTTAGTLTLAYEAPLYFNAGTGKLGVNVGDGLYIDNGTLSVNTSADSACLWFDNTGALKLFLGANLGMDGSYNLEVQSADSAIGTLGTSDISWVLASGTVTGTLSAGQYRWTQIGNIVHFWLRTEWSTNLAAVTGMEIYLPAGMPAPVTLNTPNDTVDTFGAGGFATASNGQITGSRPGGGSSALFKDSGGNWSVGVYAPYNSYVTAKYAWAQITYLC